MLFLTGCASAFTSKTVATYTSPDGTTVSWESNKEHEGIYVTFKDRDKEVMIKVEKSGTAEAVTAAALQSQIKMIDLMGSTLKATGKVP